MTSEPTTNWQAIATIVQGVGTTVALIGVGATVLLTRRGQRQDLHNATVEADRAERALTASEHAAERSEAASSLTIDQLTRLADAVERLEFGLSPTSAASREVDWTLSHHGGDTYLLENRGSGTARNIELSGHESLHGPDHLSRTGNIGPGEALTFIAARSLATSDSTITVRWLNEEGVEQKWRYPLPGRA